MLQQNLLGLIEFLERNHLLLESFYNLIRVFLACVQRYIFPQLLFSALHTNERHFAATLQQVLAHFFLTPHQLRRAAIQYAWLSGILFAGFDVSKRVAMHKSLTAVLGTLEFVARELVPNDVTYFF